MLRKNRELRQTSETFLLSAILALSGDFRMHIHTMPEMRCSPTPRQEMWFS
nr:hypothetical protein [Coprococcus eutactus]